MIFCVIDRTGTPKTSTLEGKKGCEVISMWTLLVLEGNWSELCGLTYFFNAFGKSVEFVRTLEENFKGLCTAKGV